jgi:HK97 family phage prohead protease
MTSNLETEFPTRLVTLSDGRPGLRGGIHADVREISAAGKPILEFIASDETLDRCDEIIMASGWKLETYRRNPVFQNAHKYGDVIFTLGKALVTEVGMVADRKALLQQVEFAVDINPMAKIAYGLYKGKFLNAVSVGFVPVRWENGTEKTSYRRKYIEQELLEVSAVGIPANPNALALGLKSGAIEKSDIQETFDLLRHALDRSADLQSARATPEGAPTCSRQALDHQQILKLTRDLHTLLRRA